MLNYKTDDVPARIQEFTAGKVVVSGGEILPSDKPQKRQCRLLVRRDVEAPVKRLWPGFHGPAVCPGAEGDRQDATANRSGQMRSSPGRAGVQHKNPGSERTATL